MNSGKKDNEKLNNVAEASKHVNTLDEMQKNERFAGRVIPNYEKTILLVGISSFFGPYLARAFQSRGYHVIGTYNKRAISMRGIDIVSLNVLANGEILDILFKYKPYLTVFCAGITHIEECERFPELAQNTNVTSLTFFNQTQAIHSPMIYLSCDSIFDGKNAPYNEKSIPGPKTKFAATKLAAEIYLRKHFNNYMIIRLPQMFGFNQKLNLEKKILLSLQAEKKIKMPQNVIRSIAYAPDMARCVCSIIEKGSLNTVYNLGASDSLSMAEFGQKLALAFNLNPELIQPFDIPALKRVSLNLSIDLEKFRTEFDDEPLKVEEGIQLYAQDMYHGSISVL